MNFRKSKKFVLKKKLKLLTIKKNLLWNYDNIKLIGNFQYKNLMMSVLAARVCNLSLKNINRVLPKIQNVNGRLENVRNLPNKSRIFIDFAHTPDALLTVAKTLKENCKKQNVPSFWLWRRERYQKKKKWLKLPENILIKFTLLTIIQEEKIQKNKKRN